MAQIRINVDLNATKAQESIKGLKTYLDDIVSSLNATKVDKGLASALSNLAKSYKTLADSAQRYAKATNSASSADSKAAKVALEFEKAALQKAKAQAQAQKSADAHALAIAKVNTEMAKEKAIIAGTQIAVDKYKDSIRQNTEETRKYSEETEHAAVATESLGTKFINFMSRSAKSYASWLLVRRPAQMIRQLIGNIGEVVVKTEDAVIEIRRILDEEIPADEISTRLYKIAQAYGQTFESAAEIVGNFARTGRTFEESMKATEAALLAMNVAEMDATEASDGLISVMAQFHKQAGDLVTVVDQLNKAADKNPVTTGKLLTALSRTGATATYANMSLEKTIGVITALSEATNRSGMNLGTAINSLITYSTKAKSLELFSSLSEEAASAVASFKAGAADILDVWTAVSHVIQDMNDDTEDAKQRFLSLFGGEEMDELQASLQQELGDTFDQVSSIYNVASTFRKNYFISLLGNLGRVQKVQGDIADAEGYSHKENQQYLETYTARLNTLKSKWEEVVNDENGILGFKKALVDIGMFLLDVTKESGGLAASVKEIVTLISGLGVLVNANKIADGIKGITLALSGANGVLSGIIGSLGLLAAAVVGVKMGVDAAEASRKKAIQTTLDEWDATKKNIDKYNELRLTLKDLDTDSEEYWNVENDIISLLDEKSRLYVESLIPNTEKYRKTVQNLTRDLKENYLEDARRTQDAAGLKYRGLAQDAVSDLAKVVADNPALSFFLDVGEYGHKLLGTDYTSLEEANGYFTRVENAYKKAKEDYDLAYILGKSQEEKQDLAATLSNIEEIYFSIKDAREEYQRLMRETELAVVNLQVQPSDDNQYGYSPGSNPYTSREAAERTAESIEDIGEDWAKARLEYLKSVVKLRESELDLMQKQGRPVEEQVAKMHEIQDALHEQAEFMRLIGEDQADINALSSKWYDWQEKILKLYQDTLESAKKLELDAIQAIIDSILKEIDLQEDALELNEKMLAVDKARGDLEDAIVRAKADYVNSVLKEYLTTISTAETLEQKQAAVAQAREKMVTAEREAQAKAMIEAFKAQKDALEDEASLEQKKYDIEVARKALADAENERTTRVFNEATGQFEYQANAKNVQSARDALTKAVDALNDYVSKQAWEEVSKAIESGSVTEGDIADILSKWARESYGNETPEFLTQIREAFKKAMGATADPDSVTGQLNSVDTAIKSLNDWLKQQAVNELEAYIAEGNRDTDEMRRILNKWLAAGEGSELYQWRDDLLATVSGAIDSGKYDDSKIESAINSVETAVKNLQNAFVNGIKELAKNGDIAGIDSYVEQFAPYIEDGTITNDMMGWEARLYEQMLRQGDATSVWDDLASLNYSDPNAVAALMKQISRMWYDYPEYQSELADMNAMLGGMMGWNRKNGVWYDSAGNKVYEMYGANVDPAVTASLMRNVSDAGFREYASNNGIMLESDRTPYANPVVVGGGTTDSHNTTYTVNGVPITESVAQRYTIKELFDVIAISQ